MIDTNVDTSKHVDPDGLMAAVMLAFLSTAGLFYVNLGGAFLSVFVDGIGLSREAAGYVTSANKYGAAFGALIAAFLAGRLHWRSTAYYVLAGLIAIDLLSFNISNGDVLVGIRFVHGTIGGFLVGLGLSVIARTKAPDRVFGMLLIVQYGFGSVGIFTVPKLVDALGHGAAFGALITFSIVTALMIPFIPEYGEKKKVAGSQDGTSKGGLMMVPFAMALAAVFLFQAPNMGVADYAFELGKDSGFTYDDISNLLALANIISVSGAVLVYVMGAKFGRTLPIMLGVSVSALFTAAFHYSEIGWVYFVANTVTGIAWAFTIPYLLALCSTFDAKGQMAALAGFVSKMGLASGPMIGALVVGEGNFTLIINLAIGGLVLCALMALGPALKIDRAESEFEGEQA